MGGLVVIICACNQLYLARTHPELSHSACLQSSSWAPWKHLHVRLLPDSHARSQAQGQAHQCAQVLRSL